ncbi:hypothetical protein IV203_014574 [Nitzschia inconspicua]|uniref:Uncharacterized protein n=1 Tax=Nitzschia inconspicua TaxID=303405 RepID=A0A9K3PSH4_9STRA|nr:hypothetical protein IV203_014574 [Nitzschia inconspicua]
MEDIVDHFDECRRQEREIARLRLEEDIRHKEAMVRISEEKKQLMDRVVVYDNIIKSMEVFRSALKLYNELKETMSLRQIAFAIPYCIKCFDFPSMTKQEREIFAKRFNDWAITIGLPERLDPDIFS